MPNFGLILEPIPPSAGFLGGPGGELPDIIPDGNGEPYLPAYEKQSKFGLETMNCVQFSRLNVCEAWARFHGKTLNLSDRFLYWATGCTERGNTFSNCDFGFRKAGAPAEDLWPWVTALTRPEYGKEPPDDVKAEALKLLSEWSLGQLVWVPTTIEGMRAALKKAPMLWVCNSFHAFGVYRIDDRIRVFDTYGDDAGGKGSFPLSYIDEIQAAYIAPFLPKNVAPTPMIQLPPNSLVIVADNGERLMNIDGTKLYKDDAGKILLEVTARNARNGVSNNFPIVHVKAADVKDVPRVNLKGEPV